MRGGDGFGYSGAPTRPLARRVVLAAANPEVIQVYRAFREKFSRGSPPGGSDATNGALLSIRWPGGLGDV
jgi:hypothetical protein